MRYSKTISVFVIVCGTCLASGVAQAQTTWYIDDNAASDPCPVNPACSDPLEDGSLDHPFDAIQEGIDAANEERGDNVEVADGTYTGFGNRDLDFGGKLITVRSANGPDNCIIDSQGSELDPRRGFIFQNGETDDAVVNGFTVTGGNHSEGGGVHCTGSSSPKITNCIFDENSATNRGGGIHCNATSPTITNCTFYRNSASSGGGIRTRAGSSPTIDNCTFTENSATGTLLLGYGGAIMSGGTGSNPLIRRCTFTRNTATATSSSGGRGGAIFAGAGNAVIEGCTFIDNEAVGGSFSDSGFGGGFYLQNGSALLQDCTFVGNAAIGEIIETGVGGGMYAITEGDIKITNCIFIGNKAIVESVLLEHSTGSGAGAGFEGNSVSHPAWTNCVFAGNSATDRGGGLFLYNNAQLTNCAIIGNSAFNGGGVWIDNTNETALTNCTLSGNSAGGSGGGIFSTSDFSNAFVATFVENSIVRGNLPNQIVDELLAVTTVTYSNVEDGWDGPGGNNIDADPLFLPGSSGTWTENVQSEYDQDTGKTTFTDDNLPKGDWSGMFINPDTLQPLQSLIESNTDTQIVVWGNFAALGTIGTEYQIRDYHLTDVSPVIDAGDNTAVPADESDLDGDGDTDEPIPFDLDGNPRFVDDLDTTDTGAGGCLPVDMGAYEYQEGLSACPCPADFDGDGAVGASDLAQLLGSWGPYEPCPPYHAADFNEDCGVNAADLAQLLGNWGQCL